MVDIHHKFPAFSRIVLLIKCYIDNNMDTIFT